MQISDNLLAFIWDSMTNNNCNTYLIDCPVRVLIDPGHVQLFDHVKDGLKALGLALEDIELVLCTHAHPDHIEAVQLFKDSPAQIAIHEAAWQLIKNMEQYINAAMGIDLDDIAPDFLLREGDLSIKGLDLQILHTPGHSPGSASIYWPLEKALFSGDVIFNEALGRTDLPGGDGALLKKSIQRLAELDVALLLSGHGEIVSGASAVKENFDQVIEHWFNYI